MDTIKDFPIGAKCTVSHHYGHTAVDEIMKITNVINHPDFKTGIAVSVSGLPLRVDSGLVNLIKKKNKLNK